MSAEVRAGKDQLIINGEVCVVCRKPFSLADYDARHLSKLGNPVHDGCWKREFHR